MARPLVVGNWKMHGTASSIEALLSAIVGNLRSDIEADYAVCPPSIYLSLVKDKLALQSRLVRKT